MRWLSSAVRTSRIEVVLISAWALADLNCSLSSWTARVPVEFHLTFSSPSTLTTFGGLDGAGCFASWPKHGANSRRKSNRTTNSFAQLERLSLRIYCSFTYQGKAGARDYDSICRRTPINCTPVRRVAKLTL